MICRLCLNNLNADSSCDIFHDELYLSLQHLIAQYLNLQLTQDDAISTQICHTCQEHLEDFDCFAKQVQEKQNTIFNKEFIDISCVAATNDEHLAEELQVLEINVLVAQQQNAEKDVLEIAETLTTEIKIDKITCSDAEDDAALEPSLETPTTSNNNNQLIKRNIKQNEQIIASFMQLKCNLCQQDAKNFRLLSKHFRTVHHKPPVVQCCQLMFHKAYTLAEHIKLHQNADSIKCSHCQQIFDTEEFLQAHLKCAHLDEEEPVQAQLKCHHCNKQFQFKRRLERHILKHEASNQNAFACHICDKIFRVEKCLQNHIRKHDMLVRKSFTCETCQKSFNKRASLQRHVDSLHKNICKHICEKCGRKFKSKDSFDNHVQEQHLGIKPIPEQCDLCGAWLKNKHSLYLHRLRHDVKVNCDICGRECPSRIALKNHKDYMHRTHKNLQCRYCEKQFKLASSLEEHLARHTNSYLYACEYCKKEFRSKANLYAHVKRLHVEQWVMMKRARSNNPAFQKANETINETCNEFVLKAE